MQTYEPPPQDPQPARETRLEIPQVDPILTYIIIGLLVAIHVYVQTLSQPELMSFYTTYGNFSQRVIDGEYYRLFTSMFLHAGLTHLAFNCLALYIFGRNIEGVFGHVPFLVIYLLGGLVGSVASLVFTQGNSIGASGAVFAVFGALVAYFYRNKAVYGQSANEQLRQLAVLAGINLVIGFLSNIPGSPARIDNAAHIGGAVGGLALAWFLTPLFRVRMQIDGLSMRPQLIDQRTTAPQIIAPVVVGLILLGVTAFVVSQRGG
ncbi:MAG: rhomboid family intramembrane serine protease [Anaerolineales bacterium]